MQLAAESDAPTQLVVDSQRLQQILKNLLANAIKFTEHGSVSLSIQAHTPGRVLFKVNDTGIGIVHEQTEVIFEAFRQADGSTRRRYGGTGLGLSISRDLAQRMGGSIRVDSQPGRGSCFTLELPIDGAPAELVTAAQANAGAMAIGTAPSSQSASGTAMASRLDGRATVASTEMPLPIPAAAATAAACRR